uniref:Uncharacterized protein n=1 Tax=Melopsittacus undulatus TaxID=13146 RepID=A0A8V5FHH7_MELUD
METSKVIGEFKGVGGPTFKATPCQLVGQWRWTPASRPKDQWICNKSSTYFCPASNPGKSYCNSPGHYYCSYWGCETIALEWEVKTDKYLKVKWGPSNCKPPIYTRDGEIFGPWTSSATGYKVIPASVTPTSLDSLSETINNTVTEFSLSRNLELSESKDPLWNLMQASYRALNESKPNLTEECWLCYNLRPPYFERNHTQGITIQSVAGQGKCIGPVPKNYHLLCNQTVAITTETIKRHKNRNDKWAIPTPGAKWVCLDIGVTPCLSLKVFNQSQFCIQVIIVPRLIYHTSEEVLRHFEGDLNRQKREPITVVTLATLLIAGGVGAGTGIASLVKGQELQSLQMAVDEDLAKIEQSIQNLATSVKSLSEVVLQNRRGLDLLFLKEGGLCVALNEECCSFADHTGVVQDTMSELRKRLDQRKKDREANRSWYENWFNVSPWLTTLLSTLAGPLIILILGLVFGPCILNYILRFIRERFDIAKLLILTMEAETKYEKVSTNENENCNEEEDCNCINHECICKKTSCECWKPCNQCLNKK